MNGAKKYESIHDLLKSLRSLNAAPLGHKSAATLYAFLLGYALATRHQEHADADRFLDGFNEWVRRRFKVTSDQGWPKIIAFQSADESREIDTFWKLYDDYRARRAADRERRPTAPKEPNIELPA